MKRERQGPESERGRERERESAREGESTRARAHESSTWSISAARVHCMRTRTATCRLMCAVNFTEERVDRCARSCASECGPCAEQHHAQRFFQQSPLCGRQFPAHAACRRHAKHFRRAGRNSLPQSSVSTAKTHHVTPGVWSHSSTTNHISTSAVPAEGIAGRITAPAHPQRQTPAT
jgi:hypothetical protein